MKTVAAVLALVVVLAACSDGPTPDEKEYEWCRTLAAGVALQQAFYALNYGVGRPMTEGEYAVWVDNCAANDLILEDVNQLLIPDYSVNP